MITGLVLIKMDGWITEEMEERIRGKSLSNAKQLICGRVRDDVIVDVAANSAEDLNLALGALAEVKGVRSVSVVRLIPE